MTTQSAPLDTSPPKRQQLAKRGPALPAELAPFLDDPPLLDGENWEEYRALFNSMVSSVQPRDTVEWLMVTDLVNNMWEGKRLRRLRQQVFALKRPVSTKRIIKALIEEDPTEEVLRIKGTEELLADWAKDGDKGEAQKLAFLAKYGLSPDAINAETFLAHALPLEQLERMRAAADHRRDLGLRELERRRASPAGPLRSQDVVDAETEDLPRRFAPKKRSSGTQRSGGTP